jgi:hypothetical protein
LEAETLREIKQKLPELNAFFKNYFYDGEFSILWMIYGLQIAGRRDLLDAQFPHDNQEGFSFNTLFFPSYFVSLYTLFTIGNLLMEV